MKIEARLAELGHQLPPAFVYPSPNRRGTVRVGDLLFASGHPPAETAVADARAEIVAERAAEEPERTVRKSRHARKARRRAR